ncbi:histidinol-phosphate transaminase [Promicromonospora vindobonensis]|uniref:Aromatic amino acid aminotransferase n=1 Tax=Promicromonospora vindobonensis TaxID=195748 RepID=A0ABW5VQB5_9MICO
MLTSVEEAFVPLRPAVSALPAYVPGARAGSSAPAWKLSSNENPYAPLPSVQAAITRAAAEVNRYPELYADELVGRLAAHSGVAAENVVVGNGSVALLSHVLNAVVDHGDEIVFPWRSFEAYPIAAAVSGGKAVTVPLEEGTGRLDLPAMAAAITPRTRVVLVCTPNNPTGPAVHVAELETFLAVVPKDVLVVLDEAYLEFVRDPEAPNGIDMFTRHSNVLLLRTLSKAHGLAGLRIGYSIAEPRLTAGIRSVSTPFGVSLVAQAAALATLEPEAQSQLKERVEALVDERTRVVESLRGQGWVLPETHANFVWFDLGERTMERAAQAKDAGVLVRPFAGHGIRVSIGDPEANDAFLDVAANWR